MLSLTAAIELSCGAGHAACLAVHMREDKPEVAMSSYAIPGMETSGH